ncbi:hypothetical protein PpBr36_04237 [Pyricularia pennisetigena]|uniref:hypothetical protein n=1 Tax=Pyricularia pennisetigena TaxID=1578925 RepID=UPI00115138E1|nr:hypothetical protein PpBr36_04237 [Pyricularia pennisetigena]TLS27433.1 hypothetical protein PpBr36_04237 [Pyricularia pennisetigena]
MTVSARAEKEPLLNRSRICSTAPNSLVIQFRISIETSESRPSSRGSISTPAALSSSASTTTACASAYDAALLSAAPGDMLAAAAAAPPPPPPPPPPPSAAARSSLALARSGANLASADQNVAGADGLSRRPDFLLGDGLAADLLEDLLLALGVLGKVAGVADGGEVERGTRQAQGAAVAHQAVEEGVGRGVGRLALVADYAGDGAEGDEEVELVGNIAPRDGNLGSVCSVGLLDHLSHLGRDGVGTRHNNQVPRPLFRHPLDDTAADSTRPADNNIRSISLEQPIKGSRRVRRLDQVARRGGHQDLAVRLAGLQGAEGGLDVGDAEERDGRDGPDGAVAEQAKDVVEQAAHDARALLGHEGQVHGRKGGVPVKDGHGQAGVGQDAALADLDEAAERGHALPRLAQRVARQRVEHHVHAPSGRGALDGGGKGRVAAVKDAVAAHAVRVRQEGALGGAADGGVDVCADHLREHDGRLPDAAGRRVDQHRLAPAQVGHVKEPVVGRGEDDGHGGGRLERHVVGYERGAGGLAARVARVGALGAGADAVAQLEVVDGHADGRDHARALDPQVRGRHLAHRHHDVFEVHARDLDLDEDLVRVQRAGGRVDQVVGEVQRVEGSFGPGHELEWSAWLVEWLRVRGCCDVGVLLDKGVEGGVVADAGYAEDAVSGLELHVWVAVLDRILAGVGPLAKDVAGNLGDQVAFFSGIPTGPAVQVQCGKLDACFGPHGSCQTEYHAEPGIRRFGVGPSHDPEDALGI